MWLRNSAILKHQCHKLSMSKNGRHLQVLSQKLFVPGSTGQSCVCPWVWSSQLKDTNPPKYWMIGLSNILFLLIMLDFLCFFLQISNFPRPIFHICILISTNLVLLSDLPTLSQTPPPRCERCPPPGAWIPCRVPGTSFIGAAFNKTTQNRGPQWRKEKRQKDTYPKYRKQCVDSRNAAKQRACDP